MAENKQTSDVKSDAERVNSNVDLKIDVKGKKETIDVKVHQSQIVNLVESKLYKPDRKSECYYSPVSWEMMDVTIRTQCWWLSKSSDVESELFLLSYRLEMLQKTGVDQTTGKPYVFETFKFPNNGTFFNATDWLFVVCENIKTGTPGLLKCVIASVQLSGGMSEFLSAMLYSGAVIAFEMVATELIEQINEKRKNKNMAPLSNSMITGMRSSPAFVLLVVGYVYGRISTKDPSQAVMLEYFIRKLIGKKYLVKNAAGHLSVA